MRVSFKRFVLVVYIMGCGTLSFINYRYSALNFESKPQKYYGIEGYMTFTAQESERKSDPVHSLGVQIIKNVSVTLKKYLAFGGSGITLHPPLPLYPEDSLKTDRVMEQMSFIPKKLKEKTVVIYLPNSFSSWGVKPGGEEFQIANCPVTNCLLTSKKSDAVDADAIIFRQHINTAVISPSERKTEQIWIFYMLESPENSGSYSNAIKIINWTATYRWDSDLVTPYERFTLHRDVPSDQKLIPLSSSTYNPHAQNIAQGKSKHVAWFVSHCATANRREHYVKELAKFISVDIYGACGPLKCPRRDERCWKMLDTDYKFYIAFENSNCQDYISEKYFINGLGHDAIPIVMGARESEYRRISPKHSYIHVDSFPSPKHMADYLNYLDKNDTAYNEYFQWKGTGQYINTKFWCRLCAMLNDPRPKVYDNLQTWWNTNKCTRTKWP